MTRRGPALLVALACACALVVARAHAGEATRGEVCSVVRKCSATGLACASTDRACQDLALARGLEVACDVPTGADDRLFVYCPPLSEQRDSKVVWLLLALAVLLAVGGMAALAAILRKKA